MMVSEQACCTASMAAGGANDGFRAGKETAIYAVSGCAPFTYINQMRICCGRCPCTGCYNVATI